MDFVVLCWLFAVAITIHNTEEALYLPAWSVTAGRWHSHVSAPVFRFAVVVLTLAGYLLAVLVTLMGKQSIPAYLIGGYALAMLLNVIMPHTVATLALRRYAPGLATGLILNLPVTAMLLYQGLSTGWITLETFVWVAPLVVLSILASLPILFAIGRRVFVDTLNSAPDHGTNEQNSARE